MPINSNSPTQLFLGVFLCTLPEGALKRLLFQEDVLPREIRIFSGASSMEFLFTFPKGDLYVAKWDQGTGDISYFLRKRTHNVNKRTRPIAEDSWFLTFWTQLSTGEKPVPLIKKDWVAFLQARMPDLEIWEEYPIKGRANGDP